jgi:protein-tyrosine phosphatase
MRQPARVLVVCLGNICRSPLAEGILRRQAKEQGIDVQIDSAGTGDYHIGQLADRRAIQVGTALGCEMTMRARQFRARDFEEFDFIFAMDLDNKRTLERWSGCVPGKVFLARSFGASNGPLEVPDPYYGELSDFEEVAKMLEEACARILSHLSQH